MGVMGVTGLSDFRKRVYTVTAMIPKGYVATYRQIAEALGSSKYARAVGNALHANPFPSEQVPCHRVIRSDGVVGGYARGTQLKTQMLQSEGVEIKDGRINLGKNMIKFKV